MKLRLSWPRPGEIARVRATLGSEEGLAETVIFSLKESVNMFLSSLAQNIFELTDVEVTAMEPTDGGLEADLRSGFNQRFQRASPYRGPLGARPH
jgi:hypothetical protein